jgi:hypothetical protein
MPNLRTKFPIVPVGITSRKVNFVLDADTRAARQEAGNLN